LAINNTGTMIRLPLNFNRSNQKISDIVGNSFSLQHNAGSASTNEVESSSSWSVSIVSDEAHPINHFVENWLVNNGYKLVLHGALKSGKDESWVSSTVEASHTITEGRAKFGVFFCWSGTGASMVANKVKGIRAALCTDAETARLARIWNDANVLVLSNRSLNEEVADAILNEWFNVKHDISVGISGVEELQNFEATNNVN